ncbi:MAG: hypothetical protein V1913_00145 [Fibrobacterota bacterium]
MKFTLEKKELYVRVVFSPGEEAEQDLAGELSSVLLGNALFPLFDFSLLKKLDFKILTQLEPAIQIIRKAGKKLAVACSDPTVLAVLETTGFLAEAVVFPGEAALLQSLRAYKRDTAPRPAGPADPTPQVPAGGWRNLFKIRYDFQTLLCGILFCMLVLVLVQLGTLKRQQADTGRLMHHYVISQDSLKTAQASQDAEAQVLRELEQVENNTASVPVASHPEIQKLGRNFLAVQEKYRQEHSRYAGSPEQLGWKPIGSGTRISEMGRDSTGSYSYIIIKIPVSNGPALKCKVDTRNQWQSLP